MLLQFFRRFFKIFGIVILVTILLFVSLWHLIKDRPFQTQFCQDKQAYNGTAQHFSLGFGQKRLLKFSVKELDVKAGESLCQAPEPSGYGHIFLGILDWVELHIEKVIAPYLEVKNLSALASSNFDTGELTASVDILDPFSKNPWNSAINAHYRQGHLVATGEGDIKFDFEVQPENSFTLKYLSLSKKGVWGAELLQTQGVFDKQILQKLGGSIRFQILDSEFINLSYDYQKPYFKVYQGVKNVAKGQIENDVLTAQGLLPFYDVDVSFLGIPYDFKKIDWRKLSYDFNKKFGSVEFGNIEMGGLVPMSVDKVECEGEMLNGTGVCHIGKVSGPQGLSMDGVEIIISGFNDLMGSFQGSIVPSKILPFKIPFLNINDFSGSFIKQPNKQYLLLKPSNNDDSPLKIEHIFYQQNADHSKRWVLQARVEEQPFFCHTNPDEGYSCYLTEGFEDLTHEDDAFKIKPSIALNKVYLSLPDSWEHFTQIKSLDFNAIDPTLWRFEAFNAKGESAGQIQVAFDEGPSDITSIDLELWDKLFQGVAHFDGQKLEIVGYYFDANFMTSFFESQPSNFLWDYCKDAVLSAAPPKVTIDFQHFSLANYDFGKVHLGYDLNQKDGEKRWTLTHPSLRAELLERESSKQLPCREAVLYIDNLAFLAPAVPQLQQLGKGHVIFNYHQKPSAPEKHFFYISGSDIFLKKGACQELQVLNLLSGYAFSSAQFQALLADGWLIDKLSIQGYLSKKNVFIKQSHIQSGAAFIEAKGSYNKKDDALAFDLKIQPKVSSALPSVGFLLGPFGAGLAFAGVQLFGAEKVDKIHEQQWQLYGSLSAPEIRPWEAEVIDLRAAAGEDSVAISAVILEGSDRKTEMVREVSENTPARPSLASNQTSQESSQGPIVLSLPLLPEDSN